MITCDHCGGDKVEHARRGGCVVPLTASTADACLLCGHRRHEHWSAGRCFTACSRVGCQCECFKEGPHQVALTRAQVERERRQPPARFDVLYAEGTMVDRQREAVDRIVKDAIS